MLKNSSDSSSIALWPLCSKMTNLAFGICSRRLVKRSCGDGSQRPHVKRTGAVAETGTALCAMAEEPDPRCEGAASAVCADPTTGLFCSQGYAI